MLTVLKCFADLSPSIVLSLSDAKAELDAISIKENEEIKRLFNDNYDADYYADFIAEGDCTAGNFSYHVCSVATTSELMRESQEDIYDGFYGENVDVHQ